MLPAQPNYSVIDCVRCLEHLSTSREALGARELAREMQMEPTRAHRMLKTLAHLRMVVQMRDRRYKLGAGAHVLSARGVDTWHVLRERERVLAELRGAVPHRVRAGIYWEGTVAIIWDSERAGTGTAGGVGRYGTVGATESAIGLLMLAEQSEEAERVYWNRPVPGYPDGLPALEAVLRETRIRGYAFCASVREVAPSSLAVTVEDGMTALEIAGAFGEREIGNLVVLLRRTVEQMN